jgi:hypothetical protein
VEPGFAPDKSLEQGLLIQTAGLKEEAIVDNECQTLLAPNAEHEAPNIAGVEHADGVGLQLWRNQR